MAQNTLTCRRLVRRIPTTGKPQPVSQPVSDDVADLFQRELPLIEGVIRFVVRRHRLPATQAEEFVSHARLRLIEHDYQILRRFGGRSSLRTYLATVVERLLLDYRISEWGKWRPSAEARRGGPIAVRLDQLLHRDGLSFAQAAEVLLVSERVAATRAELEAIAERLPRRTPRSFVSDDVLRDVGVPPAAEASVEAREAAAVAARTRAALLVAMAQLPARERLIVRLHYGEGLTVAQVARTLQLEQKPLYRQLERILERLRALLEAEGVQGQTVREYIGRLEWEAGDEGNMLAGPSQQSDGLPGVTQ